MPLIWKTYICFRQQKKLGVLNFVERITEFISTNETDILSIEDLDMVEVIISDKYCSVSELWKC